MNWDKRIDKAEKFLEKALEHGRKVYSRYQDEREGPEMTAKRCNIFYSNVNTLKESLFNSMPKPEVSRLHKGDFDDDVSRVAALIMQRGLTYEVKCAQDFRHAIKSAILDRLVPGIGTVWVRFGQEMQDAGDDEEGAQIPVEGTEKIYVDTVYWEDFLYEPARCWENVSWVARKLELTKKEVVSRWGADAASDMEAVKTSSYNITPKQIVENKYVVYEIWDKGTKEVIHWVKGREEPLSKVADPYKLDGFFPCPRPLIANITTTAFLPVTDFHIAQDQYIQLDVLYARTGLIIEAIKVAGAYDASCDALGRMLEGQENVLIPVDNWAMYAEKGGAKGMIDWYPVEQVVAVLQQLQQQFEHIKGILYEVTGMSDIVRGASNQYETAAAQQIKAQFASVRLNGYQRDVSEFVASVLRIMADMMVSLYSEQKFQAIVGQLSAPDAALAPQAMALLRDDFLRSYRVDIEADSLVQADWALEKTQRMELMGYVSQYLQSALPAVEQNPDLAKLLLSMLKFTVTGFRGSAEIEGIIDQELDNLVKQAQQPKQPEPSPEQQKMQMEQQQMQQQAQMEAQKMQMEQQQKMQDAQLQQQKMQMEMQIKQQTAALDAQIKQQELSHKQAMSALDIQIKQLELQIKQASGRQELGFKEASHAMDLEKKEKD